MTDPWQPPDRPTGPNEPGWGWGPPPAPPPPPASAWQTPLVVVLVIALGVAVGAVVLRSPAKQRPDGLPSPTYATRSPRPTPTPSTSPTGKPAAKPTETRPPARPQAVRTYSAPPDGIPVRGRVIDANGRPVRGATVLLQRHEGFFEGFARGFTMLFSLGLACLADICTVPYGAGRTDGNGGYTVFLEHDVDDYDLTVKPLSGGEFEARIDFAGKPLRLPEVVVWNPAPSLEQSGTRASVRFRSPPARLGAWRDASATISDAKGRSLLPLGEVRSGDSFDGRLLEDVSGRLAVSVRVRTKLGDATYSGSAAFRGHHRPLSRGRPCLEYGRSGQPVRNAPCQLTDGDLLTGWKPKVPDYQCAEGSSSCDRRVTVDLGSARRLRYVAVRVCDDFFDQVESSVDGKTWQVLIAEDSGDGGEINDVCAREVDAVARYVRVKGPQGGFYTRRSEIAAF